MRQTYLVTATLLSTLVTVSAAHAAKDDRPAIFSPTRLPRIEITIARKNWQKLCSESRQVVPSLTDVKPGRPFKYYKASVKIDGKLFKNVAVRKKGFIGSLDANRPSLKIKLDQYQKKTKYQGLSRLTLNNNKQDRSLISQYLTYRLFRKVGVHAPRCNLCEVVVNGRHLGIYSNVESIKPEFLKRSFGTSKGAYFEGTLADFYEDRISRFQPKTKKKKRLKKGRAKLVKISRVLASMKKDKNYKPLERHIDLDNFLKFWAVESLLGFWDGYSSNQNNFYIFLHPKKKQYYFIPWGTDSAFTERRFMIFMDKYKSVNARSLLCNRLYSCPAVRLKYRDTLLAILKKHWNEQELIQEMQRVERMVKGKTHRAQAGYRVDLKRKQKFVKERREKILAEVKNGPVKVTTEAGRPAYMADLGNLTGECVIDWQNARRPGKVSAIKASGKFNQKEFSLQSANAVAKAAQLQPVSFGLPPEFVGSLVLKGKRSSDGKQIQVTMLINHRAIDGKVAEEIPINGQMTTGSGFFSGFSAKPIFGYMTIHSHDKKGPRKVTFKIGIYEMRGMFGKARD